MTITTTTPRAQYNGNGATTAFSVPFEFLEAEGVKVIYTDADGVDATWVKDTHYTLTNNTAAATGTVNVKTTPSDYTPANGTKVTILRNQPLKQTTSYSNNDPFPAKSHEKALDRLAMEVQTISEKVNRAPLLKESSANSGLVFPEPEADKVIGWNADGDGLENKALTDLDDGLYVVLDEDDMASDSALAVPTQQSVKAYVDNVNINHIGYPSRFGTYDRTGVADSAGAINSALSSYKYVELGEGTFRVDSTIAIAASGRKILGTGKKRTILRPTTTNTPGISIATGLVNCEVIGLTIDRNAVGAAGGDGILVNQGNLHNIRDIECLNNYIGLNLGPIGFGQINDYFIHDNYASGIFMSNNAALGTCQWYIEEGLIQGNDGWAILVASVNNGPTALLLGDWDGVKTFANTLGGLGLVGSAAVPIHGLRLRNSFIGGDGSGGEVYLNTYGNYHTAENVFIELAGKVATGRGFATAASNTGNGLTVSANNLSFEGIGIKLSGNSNHGATLNASVLNKLTGGWAHGNLQYGVAVADGAKTRLLGVGFALNTSGEVFVTSNATSLRSEGCFPDSVNTNGQRTGTATNDSAAAGNVGEYISSVIASGSAVSLTTATPANLTSISLTAGDWDVDAHFCFTGGATTTVNYLIGSISLTSATLDATNGRTDASQHAAATVFNAIAGAVCTKQVSRRRISVSSTTTIYAVAQAGFGTSTCTVFGTLTARRVR